MAERLAAMREMFRAKLGLESMSGFSSRHNCKIKEACEDEDEDEEYVSKMPSEYGSLVAISETTTEFFDVFESTNYDLLEDSWSSDFTTDKMYSQGNLHPMYLSTAVCARKLHDFAVPKRDYTNPQEATREDGLTCNYGLTFPKDPSGNLQCSWSTADPFTFLIHGKTYHEDRKKATYPITIKTHHIFTTQKIQFFCKL